MKSVSAHHTFSHEGMHKWYFTHYFVTVQHPSAHYILVRQYLCLFMLSTSMLPWEQAQWPRYMPMQLRLFLKDGADIHQGLNASASYTASQHREGAAGRRALTPKGLRLPSEV